MTMDQQFTVLKSNEDVQKRIRELAEIIDKDYREISAEQPLLVLCTLRGAIFFSAVFSTRL